MRYVRRNLEAELSKYIKVKEIIAVVGTRQCGKTTMIHHFLDQLDKRITRISFDNFKDLNLFEEDIDSFVEMYVRDKDILFIDEVQYSKDSGKRLKYIYDQCGIKIIISGSSASEISIQSIKYLVGRIFIFRLYPFSFREFLRAKDNKLLEIYEKGEYKTEILARINKHLSEFIIYGGYPRVVISKTNEEKIKVLENVFNTYLLREIKEIFGLSENDKLIKLIKSLSLQDGNIISYNDLSSITGFSYMELKRFIHILEKTFICSQVRPFFTNKGVELVKSPKIYFFDLGFRNAAIDNFTKERSDLGSMYENFIFSEVVKMNITPKYWHTKTGAEVDFIIEKNQMIIPIEIKASASKTTLTKSYLSFIEKYKPNRAFLLSLKFEGKRKVKGCKVKFMPFVSFLNKLGACLK